MCILIVDFFLTFVSEAYKMETSFRKEDVSLQYSEANGNESQTAPNVPPHSCPAVSSRKIYVQVSADFDTLGNMIPRSILWRNGRRYEIDRVTNICHAASSKAGGHGDRYTVLICGKATYLFFERQFSSSGPAGRWFVALKAGEY